MHLAVQIFSESSSLGPGRVTHLAKHLVVITCQEEHTGRYPQPQRIEGCASFGLWPVVKAERTHLHDLLDILRRHLALDLHLGLVDLLIVHGAGVRE